VGDIHGDRIADIASANQCSVHLHFSGNGLFNHQIWYSSPDRPDKEVLTVSLQPDGKILIGGFFTSIGERPRVGIARLNSDGSLDTAFDAGANGNVNAIAVQRDGRILLGGYFTSVGGQSRIGIARINGYGALDASFNPNPFTPNHWRDPATNGLDTFDPKVRGVLNSIALQSDGKILMGGAFDSVADQRRVGIARLNEDGSLDNDFDPGLNSRVNSIIVLPDGRIVIGGDFTLAGGRPCFRIALLNQDGSLDAEY